MTNPLKKIKSIENQIDKTAKTIARRMGISESAIGKTTEQKYYFIIGARNSLKNKRISRNKFNWKPRG